MQLSVLMQAAVTGGATAVVAQPAPPVQAPVAVSVPAPAPDQAAARPVPAEQPSRQEVEQAAGKIKEFLNPSSESLEFSVEHDSGRVLVRVVDAQTKQVIRQMPSEELLAIARGLDRMQGLLISKKA